MVYSQGFKDFQEKSDAVIEVSVSKHGEAMKDENEQAEEDYFPTNWEEDHEKGRVYCNHMVVK